MILDSTLKRIRVSLGAAVATTQPDWTVNWADNDNARGTFVPGNDHGVTTGTTPVEIIDPPLVNVQRQAKLITLYNRDTARIVAIFDLFDGTSPRRIARVRLEPDEWLEWEHGGTWKVYRSDGVLKPITSIDGQEGVTNGVTTVEVAPAPPAGVKRRVTFFHVRNNAGTDRDVILRHSKGATDRDLYAVEKLDSAGLGAMWDPLPANGSIVLDDTDESLKVLLSGAGAMPWNVTWEDEAV